MKRPRLILLVVVGLLAGLLALYHHHNREPSYQGRTLTQWLEDYEHIPMSIAIDEAAFDAPPRAVKQIGTNAIPFLLKKLTDRDTQFEKRIKLLLNKQPLIRFHFTNPRDIQRLGLYGFRILEKDAQSATSDLIRLTQSPDEMTQWFALESLASIQPDKETLLPVLLRLFRDGKSEVSDRSALLLNHLYPEEAVKAGVYKNYPYLKPNTTNAPAK